MTNRRSGLTLLELVVAILLLSVGGVALASSAAALTRQLGVSARRSRASAMARTRAEQSQSRPCSALSSGSEDVRGIRSEWDVAASSGGAEVGQRVEYGSQFGQHADLYRTAATCE